MQIEINTATVALVFTLVLNFFALVWGASKMSASLNQLSNTVSRLEALVFSLASKVDVDAQRISLLEGKFSASTVAYENLRNTPHQEP